VEVCGKPTHYPWGKADDMEEVTSKSTPYPTVAEVQTSKQGLAEITSGRPTLSKNWQNLQRSAKRGQGGSRRKGVGLARELVRAMKKG